MSRFGLAAQDLENLQRLRLGKGFHEVLSSNNVLLVLVINKCTSRCQRFRNTSQQVSHEKHSGMQRKGAGAVQILSCSESLIPSIRQCLEIRSLSRGLDNVGSGEGGGYLLHLKLGKLLICELAIT